MTIWEFYEQAGGDCGDVLKRLMDLEHVRKYLIKFKQGSTFQSLEDAMKTQDYEKAFQHVHDLKGVCMNLGLKKLQTCSSLLCEELRGGNPGTDVNTLFEDVKQEYLLIAHGIDQLQ